MKYEAEMMALPTYLVLSKDRGGLFESLKSRKLNSKCASPQKYKYFDLMCTVEVTLLTSDNACGDSCTNIMKFTLPKHVTSTSGVLHPN